MFQEGTAYDLWNSVSLQDSVAVSQANRLWWTLCNASNEYYESRTVSPGLKGCILDIGFGNGNMLKRVLKKGCRSVYGTEISESCMTAVEWKLLPSLQQGYLKLAMGSAESLPFADACMDTVYSINTIYFWESLDKGLCEIARILKPQGTLLLAFYDKRFMSRLPLREYGFQLYDPKDVKAALRHNGYMSIEVHEVKKEKSYCIRAKRGNV